MLVPIIGVFCAPVSIALGIIALVDRRSRNREAVRIAVVALIMAVSGGILQVLLLLKLA